MVDVVVFPCVPATTRGFLSFRKKSSIAWGKEIYGTPLETAAWASGLSARITFPMMMRAGSEPSGSIRFSGA